MVGPPQAIDMITILDGYIDEPACLGVPPYVAPLPRYVYGAAKAVNKDTSINYLTIDEYRKGSIAPNIILKDKLVRLASSKLLVMIAGAIVPGKYLRGAPISLRETLEIVGQFDMMKIVGGAAAQQGFGAGLVVQKQLNDKFDIVCTKDTDAGVYDYLTGNSPQHRYRTEAESTSWSVLGTDLIKHHPSYPGPLIVELEAGRGCVRYYTGGCTFCSEPCFGEPIFRQSEAIIEEVKQLANNGIERFRLGAISCIFSYFAQGIGETETPKPNPKHLERLLAGIRAAAPRLKVLHLDNGNPAIMAAHIKETKAIIKIILKYCTGGNILSFGLESADPKVIKANNLNTNPTEVEEMVKLVNHYGAIISNTGMPMLLPGLNLVYGLKDETKETFKLNFEFLKSLLDQKLLLRRINLRQVQAISESTKEMFNTKKNHRKFIQHKKMVREQIDRHMLEQMLPVGTVLKNVFTEKLTGNITFGRQFGTYPILVGIPYELPLNMFHDIVITEYGFRSLTGFPSPFNVNHASKLAFESLPGIGAKRAIRLLNGRPYLNKDELSKALDDESIIKRFEDHLIYESED